MKTPDHHFTIGWATWLRDLANAGGTGGLNWHVHALRSMNRWLPTRELIASFLAQVQPTQDQLLLIGCSAGWMLPNPWLMRFKRIHVYDIDPLVPMLFGLRHGKALSAHGVELSFHRQNAIAGLPRLLQQHPDACLWFDNVLGQVGFLLGDEDMAERQLGQLKALLKGRAWGSLHDMYSGPIDAEMALPGYQTVQWTRLDELPEAQSRIAMDQETRSHAEAAQALLTKVHAKGVWHDHSTQTVFAADTVTTLMPWAFKPHYWHWLQAAWVKP